MDSFGNYKDQVNQQHLDEENLSVAKIPVLEERLNIGIRQVETGTVQLHKKVISEEVTHDVLVTQEEVEVERVAINQYVEAAPATRYENDVTIIPVVKEVLVVQKKLMLVEELHITKKQVISTTTVKETLRKEEVEINRIDATENSTTQQINNNLTT